MQQLEYSAEDMAYKTIRFQDREYQFSFTNCAQDSDLNIIHVLIKWGDETLCWSTILTHDYLIKDVLNSNIEPGKSITMLHLQAPRTKRDNIFDRPIRYLRSSRVRKIICEIR
jgi:hypothetical protein